MNNTVSWDARKCAAEARQHFGSNMYFRNVGEHTRRYTPEDNTIRSYRCENLRRKRMQFYFVKKLPVTRPACYSIQLPFLYFILILFLYFRFSCSSFRFRWLLLSLKTVFNMMLPCLPSFPHTVKVRSKSSSRWHINKITDFWT